MTAEQIRDQDAELGIDSSWYRNGESPYMHLTGSADVPQGSLQHRTDDFDGGIEQAGNARTAISATDGADDVGMQRKKRAWSKRNPIAPHELAKGFVQPACEGVSPRNTECWERIDQSVDIHGPRKRNKRVHD